MYTSPSTAAQQLDEPPRIPTQQAPGIVLDDLVHQVAAAQKLYHSSSIATNVRRFLAQPGQRSFQCAIALGLGSFSSVEGQANEASFLQLAMFLDMTAHVNKHETFGTYAQDPAMTELDARLLQCFGVQAILPPNQGMRRYESYVMPEQETQQRTNGLGSARRAICEDTLLFAPSCEFQVIAQALSECDPKVYIGAPLDHLDHLYKETFGQYSDKGYDNVAAQKAQWQQWARDQQIFKFTHHEEVLSDAVDAPGTWEEVENSQGLFEGLLNLSAYWRQ